MDKKIRISTKAKIGAGLGLVAAVGAGIYFLTGEKGRRNRQNIQEWVMNARAQILSELKKLEDVKKKDYYQIIEKVMKGCNCKNKKEISAVMKDMKKCWSGIEKEVKTAKKRITKVGKKIKVIKK